MNADALLSKLVITNINRYLVTDNDAENLCLKAKVYGLAGTLLGPSSLAVAARHKGAAELGVAVSYPSGVYPADAKTEEIAMIEADSGSRVDVYYAVMAVGNYLGGAVDAAREEIAALAGAVDKPVRLIVETTCLDDVQLREVCGFAADAGVDAIVTSACFAPYELPRATPEQAARVRKSASGSLKVIPFVDEADKAAVEAMLNAGADYLLVNDINTLL